ncbi:MAG: ribosome maturation factor RimP [Alphaproteobacteria bacterium]|nr:ribosome maturation factor RimP [Alphaproteobacteria bacterium]
MVVEEKIENAISSSLENLGYEIVQIKYFRSENSTLQLMIDKVDGRINLDDCTKVSRIVSTIMDVEDFISEHYNLEVTSPGINRPLIKKKDFVKFQGRNIQFRLKEALEGSRNFKGKIESVIGDEVSFNLEGNNNIRIEIKNIETANLL